MTLEKLNKMDACRHLLPEPGAEAVGELIIEVRALKAENARLSAMADKLLAHLDDGSHESGGECSVCSVICCPHGEPLHFHHDGCPACHANPT